MLIADFMFLWNECLVILLEHSKGTVYKQPLLIKVLCFKIKYSEAF